MAITPVDEIHRALKEAYIPEYYGSIYRQIKYAFGEKWDDEGVYGDAGNDDFPDFPAVKVRQLAIGQSRRILNAQFVDLARNMYSPGDPEFPDVDRVIGLVRKAFFKRRAEQGEWDTARAAAFMEGNGLGVGFLQVGVITNPKTGKKRVHLRHSPTCLTLWDPHQASAANAGYVCFVQDVPINQAIALYGERIDEHATSTKTRTGHELRTVRIFEYFDLGLGRWKPTYAVIPGRMLNDPIKRTASHWEDRLPFAFYEHLLPPMTARPIGRIPLMMPTQEAINEIEAYLRTCSKKRPIDVIDPKFVDPQDLARVENGTSNVLKSLLPLAAGQKALDRIPAEVISETAMHLYEMLQQQFNEDSGTTEYDRGGSPEGTRTAYEANSIQQGVARQGGWTDKQSAAFAVRTVEAVEAGAILGDEDPVDLMVLGKKIPINVAGDPGSSIGGFLAIETRVLVDEESLRKRDAQQEGAVRLQALQALNAPLPLVGQIIDPKWYAEEMLRAIGEDNPDAALLNGGAQGPPGAPPTLPPGPGQAPPPGAPAQGIPAPAPGIGMGTPAAPPTPIAPPA